MHAARNSKCRTVALFCVALCAALPAIGETPTYRWRDAEGGVHFGDKPPAGVVAEPLKVRPQPSRLTPAEADAEVRRLRAAEASRAETAARQKATATAAERARAERQAARQQRCEEAKWALAALDSGRPVYRDEQNRYRIKRPPVQGDAYTGKREYLDEATRQREIAVEKRRIAENCGGQPTPAERARTEEEILHAEECEKAAADLQLMLQPQSGATDEDIAARRAFLNGSCGG